MNADQLRVVEADDTQKEIAFRQVFDVWPSGSTIDEHVQWRLASPQHQRAVWYVGCCDDEVVCSLGAYPLRVRLRGVSVDAFAIGAVHTAPAHRGRGFAPRLIEGVETLRRTDGAQLSMLYSDIGVSYYRRIGYQACPAHRLRIPAAPAGANSQLTLSPSARSETRAEAYEASIAHLPFAIDRDESYWRFLDSRVPSSESQHTAAERQQVIWNGQDVGSLQLAVDGRTRQLHLVDYAFTTSEPKFWRDLCGVLSEFARRDDCDLVAGWAPRIDILVACQWLEPRPDEITMLKPLAPTLELSREMLAAADHLREADHV